MTRLEIPDTMRRLPRQAGRPVPFVAAWSTERWSAVRYDPAVQRHAVFTSGRPGRGRAVFGAMNEPRQRHAMVNHLCGVCAGSLAGGAWLPFYESLADGEAELDLDGETRTAPIITEPPCCHACASWAARDGCPGIPPNLTGPALIEIRAAWPILQLVDPSAAPMAHDRRFDGHDDPDLRARLGATARRHGGAVGYVRLALLDTTTLDL